MLMRPRAAVSAAAIGGASMVALSPAAVDLCLLYTCIGASCRSNPPALWTNLSKGHRVECARRTACLDFILETWPQIDWPGTSAGVVAQKSDLGY